MKTDRLCHILYHQSFEYDNETTFSLFNCMSFLPYAQIMITVLEKQNYKVKKRSNNRLSHTFLSHLCAGPGHISSELNIYSPFHFPTCFTMDNDKSFGFIHGNSKQMIIPTCSCQIQHRSKICRETKILLKW